MRIALLILFMVCPLAALTFIVRVACAPFSPKVSDEMHRHPVIHWIWGGFAFLGVLLFLGVLNPSAWPLPSIERREQRRKLLERLESAGGWDAIRRDCVVLTEQHTNGFYSHWGDTNLPSAILALKPRTVEYSPHYGRVSMRIFGIHSTGGHSTPYFGLEVVTRKTEDYKPGAGYGGGVSGNYHSTFSEVADGIYEIY
jgi:hypothetical protein